MRSRPDLTLYLSPRTPLAGSRMRAEAVLESRSETPIEGVEFHLRGIERRHTGTAMAGNVPVAQYATAVHVDLFGRTPATTLGEGKHTFAMSFDLPPTAPPAYRSNVTLIEYTLGVRVVIPWWPDRIGRYIVPLGATPRDVRAAPASFCTDGRGPQGAALYIEASLDSTTVALGGVVTGAASIGNVEHHRVRRVELSLVAMERVSGTDGPGAETGRYTVVIHEGPPADSRPIPFRVKFPADAAPSFRGALVELRWLVEIRAVIGFGTDVTLPMPLDVVRRPEGASAAPVASSRVPPVGRERRAIVWAEVARRHGFDNDAEEERMTRDLGAGGLGGELGVPSGPPIGRCALEITLEPRREGGLATVARLRFPPLGVGFSITEKRWTDALSRRPVATGHAAFDERFTARGREEAQVRAFLDEASRRALLTFERASADDGGATFEGASTAQSVEDLDELVARALAAARALVEASRRIPPPAAMAAHVPAWRELAALTSGRLQIGGMAIREAVFEHFPLELVTEWSDEGTPAATIARLFLPEPDEADRDRPFALPGPAEPLVAALSPRVRALDVTRERVEATLPAPLADPHAVVPILEGLAQLARALEGKTGRGPYR